MTKRNSPTKEKPEEKKPASSPKKTKIADDKKDGLKATCFCGHTTVTVPDTASCTHSSYCHCNSCKKWYAAPIVWYLGMKEGGFTIDPPPKEMHTNPKETSHKTYRRRCVECGSDLGCRVIMGDGTVSFYLPMTLFVDEKAKLPKGLPKPMMHAFYSLRVMDVVDGVPKYKAWEGEVPEKDE
ncbi:hypothetical protein HDV03_003843 [Kappamyces sp. JEL0829]|nr:hypothetical protein HDV03_003843 [Kappamyces sp. JEL0829]KAJ3365525.1 hypothetical protein HDU91_002180 [Kappamyces sp. JEL0680]